MYVYIYIYMYMYIYIYKHIYICIYIYIFVCTYMNIYVYTHAHIHIYIYICMLACIYTYLDTYTYTLVYVMYMHVCVSSERICNLWEMYSWITKILVAKIWHLSSCTRESPTTSSLNRCMSHRTYERGRKRGEGGRGTEGDTNTKRKKATLKCYGSLFLSRTHQNISHV